ncbi:Transcription factor 1 [Pseudocercospora fuligena]|uniref:Transcription factor 1 n=1 Tax=Pseudocercospora fuligena TaxID=685502 RepID=A0A8H6RRE9_9PEZI|nr:Transcription factor 1 [Pseudocercospora fuligena]
MVFCTYCGQSFTRDEHLERHILTHTNVKPFKCFTCHMSFARRDLLQRHYTVHGRDATGQQEIPAANGMIPKSAGRTPIACSNCAKTKTKCDKKFPCSRCAGRNLRCTLRPTRRVSKNAARVGIPPEGAVAMPPGVQQPGVAQQTSTENGQQPQQTQQTAMLPPATTSPQQQPPTIKPASPQQQSMSSIPEDRPSTAPPVVDGPPTQYADQPTSGPTPPTTFSPQMPTPGAQFMHNTPLSGYNEFANNISKDSSDAGSSPRFMLDWSQMQMPIGYDGLVQPHMIMNAEIGFDPNVLPLASNGDGMLTIMPDVANGMQPIMTPLETPKLDRQFHDMELNSSATAFQQHSHRPSNAHSMHSNQSQRSSAPDVNGEMPSIIAAQDAWSAFRCTPIVPSTACPKTARQNLERLEQTLRNHQGWASWSPQWEEADIAGGDHLTVMQLHESTRDKLLAITQSFLHKALEIHRQEGQNNGQGQNTDNSYASNFVLLPPGRVLEYFLRSYANSFERYYPLTSRGILDANELMHCYNDKASSLLVLMMIAQGAMNIPSTEARMLTGGLTEACRISLFDLIEKDIIMSGDPIVLHAALLFTVQAAWSGDKWQMDIAMGQRGMYLAMLRHSGILERISTTSNSINQQGNRDQLWSEWIQNEARSRLMYSWVMVDQDLALFHDTAPLFSVTEFGAPMPDADRLWQARSAVEWSTIFEQVHEFSGGYSSVGSGARPLSLRDLFRHFLDDEMIPLGIEMTPLQMRLLLHPLQSLVYQQSQLLSCFSEASRKNNNAAPRTISASSTRTRLEEAQSLLGRWFDLAERYLKANPLCPMMQTNLVIFHLISLNAVTNFQEIERLARRENFDGTYQNLVWMHKRCIQDVEEAVYHCGQVFRLIRAMPRGTRPPWWAGAIYRVALVLWTDSLTHKEQSSPNSNGMFPVPGPSFAIDALTADHPLIIRYLTKREGVPCVTKRDGSQMSLDRAFNVLQHCIEVIDEGAANRFSDGIRSKLERLARG